MKKFLKENVLKLTIFGNLFALLGTAYFLIFWFVLFWIAFHNGAGMAIIICEWYIIIGYLVVSAIVVLGLILELLFRHRLKNEFFKENKIYNILFYIGLSLTFLSYLFIYAIVFLIP